LFAAAADPPEGDQEMEIGAVPCEIETDAEPFVPPLQITFAETDAVAIGDGALATFTLARAIQPLASVTSMV